MTEEKSRKIMANNINKFLKLAGKTKADLSRDLGIPYSTVRDWCTGTSYPRIDALDALVKYFNISRPMLTMSAHYSNSGTAAQCLYCRNKKKDPDRSGFFLQFRSHVVLDLTLCVLDAVDVVVVLESGLQQSL